MSIPEMTITKNAAEGVTVIKSILNKLLSLSLSVEVLLFEQGAQYVEEHQLGSGALKLLQLRSMLVGLMS